MAKVDTNSVRMGYAREALDTPGTKPSAGWRAIEVNPDGLQFGATIVTTPREPISDKLQRRKGAVTDLDSTTAFTTDATVSSLWDWLEAAIFAKSVNADVRDMAVTSVTTGQFDVAMLVAAQAAKIAGGTLFWARGFGVADNNGLQEVTVGAGATDNEIEVTGLVADGAGTISLAGARFPNKSGAAWAWGGTATKRATLTYAGHGLTDARGLRIGQLVHFGSVASAGATVDELQNGLSVNAMVGLTGFARLISRETNMLVFDRVDEALQVDVALGTAGTDFDTDLLFGDFIRNVARSDDDYIQQAHSIEQVSPDLGDGSPGDIKDAYEYAVGQVIGSLVLNFPLTDKVTMNVNFVGQDTEKPVYGTARATGAAAALEPIYTEAFNTSADFARLRILDIDDDGITSDFKNFTLTINPQTSPEKVLGKLGARFINRGNLLVDSEAQVIFTDPRVVNGIRDNATLSFESIIGNNDGVFAFEVPSQTLGGGGREYPANQAVLINTTGQSFEDDDFETSIHVSFIPVPIPTETV